MKRCLVGNGGHAREVMAHMGDKDIVRFVSDEYWTDSDPNVRPLSTLDVNEFEVMVAIGDSNKRENIVRELSVNTKYFTFIHDSAEILSDDIIIGDGSFVGAKCVLTTNIKIGRHAVLNRGNHVGHDCVIGDFFSAMPGSIVSGHVNIGDVVYLGTNSSVREKVSITDSVKVGLNTGVVSDITEPGTYVGTPAKKIN